MPLFCVAEATDVECERCGASVPLVSSQHARCVYCFHDQPLPPEVARAVTADAALEAKLEHAAGEGERRFAATYKAGLGPQIFLFVAAFLGAIPVLYLAFSTMGDASSSGRTRTVMYMIFLLPALLVPALPLVWLRFLKRSKERVFAALPLARVEVEEGTLVAGCPSCGARLSSGGEVSVVCAHCQTQSLLPQPLIATSLRRRHARVIELRLEGQAAAHDATAHAVSQWQKKVVPMVIRFNILVGVLIAAAVIAYELATP